MVTTLITLMMFGQANRLMFCGSTNFCGTSASSDPTYATQAPIALFIDPTGNDSNACTASGIAACLTIQGAYGKLPKLIQDPVSISVAAGTYVDGAVVQGFRCAPRTQAAGAWVNLVGTLANATLATGTATGTATAGSAGSGVTFGTITDGAQTWTVNNLKNFAAVITSGTGSGQFRVISSNTATAATIVGTWATAPDATSVYQIADWASVVTGTVLQAALPDGSAAATASGLIFNDNDFVKAGNGAVSCVTVTRMKIAPSTVNTFAVAPTSGSVGIRESNLTGNAAGGGLNIGLNSMTYVTVDASVSRGTTSGGGVSGGAANSFFVANRSIFESPTTGSPFNSGAGFITIGSNAGIEVNSLGSGATAAISVSNAALIKGQWLNTHVNCTAGGSTVGLNVATGESQTGGGWSGPGISSWAFTNCPTGVQVTGPTQVNLATSCTFTGSTTGVSVLRGGRVFYASNNTITAATTDLSVDGNTLSTADLTAGTTTAATSIYGSAIFR